MNSTYNVVSAVESTYVRYTELLELLKDADASKASEELDKFFISSMRSILGTYYLSKLN